MRPPLRPLHPRRRGFTLIELMIVVVVVAILALVALPSFMDSIRRSRRADAYETLGQIQQQLERFRANNPTYGPPVVPTTSRSKYYSIDTVVPAAPASSPDSYKITASATGSQAADVQCAQIIVDFEPPNFTYRSSPAPGVPGGTPPDPYKCWKR